MALIKRDTSPKCGQTNSLRVRSAGLRVRVRDIAWRAYARPMPGPKSPRVTACNHLPGGSVYRGRAMPYRNEAAAVLAMWHDIEQALNAVPRESDEALELLDEWARLRTEYVRLTDLARAQHRPLPDPWPGL